MFFTRKVKSVVTAGFALLALVFAFSSCKIDVGDDKPDYSVTYDANAGESTVTGTVEKQSAKEGESVTVAENAFVIYGKKFVSWNTQADGLGNSYLPGDTITLSSDITLYAQWIIQTCTVSFKANGGTGSMEDQLFTYGVEQALTINSFEREGWYFNGWNTLESPSDADTGTAYSDGQSVTLTEDLVLYAQWIEKSAEICEVKYDSKGGSLISSALIEQGKTAEKPADPIKTGYTFKGWFTSDDEGETLASEFDFASPILQAIVLYAKWEINNYTVKYDTDGGTEIVSETVEYNQTATKPENPQKTDYTFEGWFTSSDNGTTLSSTEYDFETLITSDITLYAKWKIISYTVKYIVDSNVYDTINADYNTLATQPDVPTKDTATFEGWYLDNAFSTKFDFNTPIVKDITLYARWKFTVTFETNGGTAISPVVIKEGEVFTLLSEPTKTELTFKGWYTDSALTEKFLNQTITENITLYALWECEISFSSNGGTSVPSQSIAENTYAEKPENPSRTGYDFDGWFTSADGGTTLSETPFDFTKNKVTKNIIFYANWTPQVYNIIYLDEDGTEFSGTHETDFAEKHIYDTPTALDTPKKDEFIFTGWHLKEADGTLGNAIEALSEEGYTDDITLYASWKRVVYHVSASGDDSTGDGSLSTPLAKVMTAVNKIQSLGIKTDYEIVVSGTVIENINLYATTLSAENADSLTIRGATGNSTDSIDGNNYACTLYISTLVPVTLKDIKIAHGKSSSNAGGVVVAGSYPDSSYVTFASGVLVTENECTSSYSNAGGGVAVYYGTLTIEEGAKITNNTSKYGAGVCLNGGGNRNWANLIMNGGEISGNTASVQGGGVLSYNYSNFTMNDGKITDNTVNAYSGGGGGGVCVSSSSGTFIMNGGEISGNSTDQYGGGVKIDSYGTFTMNGGTIKNNVAQYGGAVCNYYGSFTMTGAAYIPVGEDNKNDVFLNYDSGYMGSSGTNRCIYITEELTAPTPVATITSRQMIENKYLLYSSDISLLEQEKDKFAYNINDGTPWNTEISGNYVVLKRPVYNITYLEKGGDELLEELAESDQITHKYGTATTLPVITKSGYVFLGWYKESDCSGLRLTELVADGYTDDITLYADWEEEMISVTVLSDDITITKLEDSENGTITLRPAAGFMDYTWTINGTAATSVIEGATVSSTDSSLTFSKANLTNGRSYSIVLTAKNANGKTFMTLISIKK